MSAVRAVASGPALPAGKGIIWLASYPKSGNTWARMFLSSYFRESNGEVDINNLYGGPIASSRLLFDHAVGIEAANLRPREIQSLRPAVYEWMKASAAQVRFVKVHDAWTKLGKEQELFPAAATYATLYIVRNPLDVAVSAAHHNGQSLAQTVEQLCDERYALSMSRHENGPQLRQRVGSWSSHARSWLRDSGQRVHLMRFEDMLRDPAAAFSTMLRFIGAEIDTERLLEAVAASSFEKLQQQEQEQGFRERRIHATAPFFRKGMAGNWREELPEPLARRLLAAHAPMMRELGYVDAAGQPVY